MVPPMERLIKALGQLPSVGRRSAERMAIALARNPKGILQELRLALEAFEKETCACSRCGAVTLTSRNPCAFCTDSRRDGHLLCIVEDIGDIMQLEKADAFRGRYHVMGKLSPARNQQITVAQIDALKKRIEDEKITEIILALNTDVESDATAAFLAEHLAQTPVKISRLASGLPAGSGIAYSDPVSLARALQGRHPATLAAQR
ncbi:MAG: recombination protein RecR [Spartobacteria bacterium]|nr:recombination protein RecR [Spartobacteria bacterium]